MTNEKNILSLVDYYRELQMDVAQMAVRSTCQFVKLDSGSPIPYASGVFIMIDQHPFLLTAAHVVDDNSNDLYVPVNDQDALKVGGEWTINALSDGKKREHDPCDAAIMKVNEESHDRLKERYFFMSKFELGINHEDPRDFPEYVAIGFPTSRAKYNPKTAQTFSRPFIYSTVGVPESVYQKMTYSPNLNLIVNYDK